MRTWIDVTMGVLLAAQALLTAAGTVVFLVGGWLIARSYEDPSVVVFWVFGTAGSLAAAALVAGAVVTWSGRHHRARTRTARVLVRCLFGLVAAVQLVGVFLLAHVGTRFAVVLLLFGLLVAVFCGWVVVRRPAPADR